jgi:hypothetical protein
MKKLLPLLFITVFLIGCKTTAITSVPEGYTGDVVNINDTYERQSSGSAIFFYTDRINNIEVHNALRFSAGLSTGQGNRLNLTGISRKMPLTTQRIHLVGQYFHIVPIVAMFGSEDKYTIKGMVTLEPKANTHYVIKGSVSEAYSAVWIEDHQGKIVTNVVERMGADPKKASDIKRQLFEDKSKEQSKEALFASLSGGEPVALVNRKLGQPVNAIPIPDHRKMSINRYKDLGSVQFSGYNNASLFVTKTLLVTNDSVNVETQVEQQLATQNGASLRQTIRKYYDQDLYDPTALDLMAQKLWQERYATERNMVDAMAWICRLLNRSKNGRYYDLLTSIAQSDNDGKLRKWARKSLLGLVRGNTVQFVPAG